MESVLVTGGTGRLGRVLVPRLHATAAKVRVLTRSTEPGEGQVTGDLTTGEGLEEAVSGVDTIIHCATNTRMGKVDVQGTQRLLYLARRSDVRHLLYVSIVGIDHNPFRYYRTKERVEQMVDASGVPYTIQRATQFHQLIVEIMNRLTKLPVVVVPRDFRSQPIDAEEVAARLADLAAGDPVGRARDIGGPRVDTIDDLLQVYCAAVGKSRPVLQVGVPGKAGRAFRAGSNLLRPGGEKLGGTFDDFLAKQFPQHTA